MKEGKPIIRPIIPIIRNGIAKKNESRPFIPTVDISPTTPQLFISNPIINDIIEINEINPLKNKPSVPKINLDSFSLVIIITTHLIDGRHSLF